MKPHFSRHLVLSRASRESQLIPTSGPICISTPLSHFSSIAPVAVKRAYWKIGFVLAPYQSAQDA